MILYGIRNCDTVRQARAWLDGRGATYRFHDFRVDGLNATTLRRWVKACPWEELLNRRSAAWRTLPPMERNPKDAGDAIALMLAYPTLIRRPVLEAGGGVVAGFAPEVWKPLLDVVR